MNYELLELYWGIGRDIVAKQKHAKWGDAFLATMSKDLQKSFPDMSGFSVQNLKSIRYWYKFYNSEENGLQPVSRMELIENMVKSIPCKIEIVHKTVSKFSFIKFEELQTEVKFK